MKLLIVQPSSTSYYFSLGPVILLSTMFSTTFICSIEHNFKYYQKNTTTSFIELHKEILQSTIQIYLGLHATCPIMMSD